MMFPVIWLAPVLGLGAIPLATVVLRHLRGRGLLAQQEGLNALRLEETIALDPRRRLHLVSCSGKRLVVLTGGPQDVSMGWLPEA